MVVIRHGTQADVAPAATIWGAAIGDLGDHTGELRAKLAQPGSFWVVAEDGGEVTGTAVCVPALERDGAGPGLVPGLCHLTMVGVAPERWGQGIGGALVDALLAGAAARGFTAAQLWADPANPRAVRLYTGRGFAATGRGDGDAHYHMALPGSSPEIR